MLKSSKGKELKGYNANHKVQSSNLKVQSLIVALSSLSTFKLGSL